MNSTYQSIGELLQWFAVEPRTKRWDAMLAFDQSTVNTLLLQQYIERFNSDSYLPRVNTSIDLGNGSVAEIRNYVFDQPRLSFENANLDAPTATLRMQGLGGVRLNWNVSGSTRKLESISYEYPVNGDVHESVVELTEKSASVRAHKVIIDVATGERPLLKFGATLNEKQRAGEKVKSLLQVELPLVREYVLSEVKAPEGSLLEPKHILLLTQPAPEGRVRNSAHYGDGAVLVFVAFKDGVIGDRPYSGDPQWRYLLDPKTNGHSAIIVFSIGFVLSKLIANALMEGGESGRNSFSGDGFLISTSVANGWPQLVGEGSIQLSGGETLESNSWSMTARLDIDEVYAKVEGGRAIHAGWGASGTLVGTEYDNDNQHPGNFNYDINIGYVADIDLSVAEDGTVRLVGDGRGIIDSAAGYILEKLQERTGQALLPVTMKWVQNINTAQVAGLVLAGDQPVRLKGAEMPGDLVMYGNVSDERTGLVLNQLEALVGAGTTLEFLASGAGTGAVTWSLEKIDGEASNAGSITPAGLYTAPQITSTYARVRLTATRGTHTTQALITVARELAAISPAVQLAVAGAGARYFVRGGAASYWQWDTSGLKGQLVTPVPEPGDEFEPGDMQYIPPATIDGDFFVEQIKIKVGANVTSSAVVVTNGSTIDIAANVDTSATSATLTSSVSGKPLDVVYTKVAGAGTLSGNVVTSEQRPAEPFIVVQAAFGPFMGYLLLPLPLSVLEGSQSLLMLQDPSRTFDCSMPGEGNREVSA